MFLFASLGLAAISLFGCLAVDGVLPISPWLKLVNFPFRDRPATNGMAFTFSVLAAATLADWVVSGIGMLK